MLRPVRRRTGTSEDSSGDKSIPIWTSIIGGIALILAAAIPVILASRKENAQPTPPSVERVQLKPPLRCKEFPDAQAMNRNEFRWLRDLCLGLEKEAKGTSHFPAVVLETTIISEGSAFRGRVQCGVYTAIDGYAFLADAKKETFTPLRAYAEREANECAFRFETPRIMSAQSIFLVLMISGEPSSLTQAGIRNLALEVNP
jgi:hypothetical protein